MWMGDWGCSRVVVTIREGWGEGCEGGSWLKSLRDNRQGSCGCGVPDCGCDMGVGKRIGEVPTRRQQTPTAGLCLPAQLRGPASICVHAPDMRHFHYTSPTLAPHTCLTLATLVLAGGGGGAEGLRAVRTRVFQGAAAQAQMQVGGMP